MDFKYGWLNEYKRGAEKHNDLKNYITWYAFFTEVVQVTCFLQSCVERCVPPEALQISGEQLN
jgi:hypothetical protein